MTTRDRVGEKRRRIIDAARGLILRQGLRATTMEAVAREAGIAKPTLYGHFADKDALFCAIVDELMDDVLSAHAAGLAAPGSVAERVGAALSGQFVAIARALAGSPHAGELMNEHRRAGAAFRDKDNRAETEITAALVEAGIADAPALTHTLMASAYGIALKFTDEAAMNRAIRLVCRRVIEGACRSRATPSFPPSRE